jgi:hypothetical protein
MPHKAVTVSGNTNSGAWLQLDKNTIGTVSVAFYNESQPFEFVCNATSASIAGDEKTANRTFKVAAGGIVSPVRYDLDPSTTWVRSTTTTATAFQAHFQW